MIPSSSVGGVFLIGVININVSPVRRATKFALCLRVAELKVFLKSNLVNFMRKKR